MVVCDGREDQRHSFWANGKEQESEIFEQFMEVVSRYENPCIYCSGSHERAFLKRMRRLVAWQMQADKLLAVSVNTLSISRWQLSPCAQSRYQELNYQNHYHREAQRG
jgi:hypothetical protein